MKRFAAKSDSLSASVSAATMSRALEEIRIIKAAAERSICFVVSASLVYLLAAVLALFCGFEARWPFDMPLRTGESRAAGAASRASR